MIQTLTNNTIYAIATSQAFADFKSYIPAKANFAIQKNFATVAAAAQGIDEARLEVAKHYGTLDEENSGYRILDENLSVASQEIADLFNTTQDLDIRMIKVEDLGAAEFTPAQMQLIMFMIED